MEEKGISPPTLLLLLESLCDHPLTDTFELPNWGLDHHAQTVPYFGPVYFIKKKKAGLWDHYNVRVPAPPLTLEQSASLFTQLLRTLVAVSASWRRNLSRGSRNIAPLVVSWNDVMRNFLFCFRVASDRHTNALLQLNSMQFCIKIHYGHCHNLCTKYCV